MIPLKLEEIVLRGGGIYKNHVHAISGAGTIKVTKDTWIAIFHIPYFHFVDLNAGGVLGLERINTQVNFTSKERRFHYAFRDCVIQTEMPGPADQFNVCGETNLGVYQVHGSDVAIDILKYRDPAQWGAIVIAPLPAGTPGEPVPSLGGYGTVGGGVAEPVLQTVTLDGAAGDERYVPLGGDRGRTFLSSLPPAPPEQNFEFNVPADAGPNPTTLTPADPANPEGNFQYPLMNISYVEINEDPPADLIK